MPCSCNKFNCDIRPECKHQKVLSKRKIGKKSQSSVTFISSVSPRLESFF